MRDVAELAGTSTATVSNAINRPEIVSAKVRNRVQSAIQQLGYVRNESARTLRTGRSDEIGLVVPNATNPFWGPIIAAADMAADQFDAVISLSNSFEDLDRQQRIFGRLINHRVRGVLVAVIDRQTEPLHAFREAGIPIVLMGQRSENGNFCSVSTDDVAGGRLIGEYLAELGHRSVAFVGDKFPDRCEAIAGPVRSAGGTVTVIPADPSTLVVGERVGHEIASRAKSGRPTALACSTDMIAIGVIQALIQEGVDVPGDISVTGFDDILFSHAAAVPLTTIRQSAEELGTRAVRLLNDEISEGSDHRHSSIVFHPDLIRRQSTGAAHQ